MPSIDEKIFGAAQWLPTSDWVIKKCVLEKREEVGKMASTGDKMIR